VWPPGNSSFVIHPERKGNGVRPIKDAAITYLVDNGWKAPYAWPVGAHKTPGNLDAAYLSNWGLVGFEWETGNISSSHRSINKLCLGLLRSETIGGFLVVPSRKLYKFLTDRIGNIGELEPYFDFWAATPCVEGTLSLIVIEQDDESLDVPKISKGTDGRSLR
jgi:hypothetical protein